MQCGLNELSNKEILNIPCLSVIRFLVAVGASGRY